MFAFLFFPHATPFSMSFNGCSHPGNVMCACDVSEAKNPTDLSKFRVDSSSSEATAVVVHSIDDGTGSQEPLHDGVAATVRRAMQWRSASGTRREMPFGRLILLCCEGRVMEVGEGKVRLPPSNLIKFEWHAEIDVSAIRKHLAKAATAAIKKPCLSCSNYSSLQKLISQYAITVCSCVSGSVPLKSTNKQN